MSIRLIVAVSLLVGAISMTSARAADPPERRQTALLMYALNNPGDTPADNVQLLARLPVNNPYQRITRIEMFPPPAKREYDFIGQTQCTWRLGRIGPGQTRFVLVLVQATLQPVRIDASTRAQERLLPAQRADYLRDDPKYLNLPEVAKISAEWAPKPSDDTFVRARQYFEAIRKNCTYVLDNKRDTAMDVLKDRQGSCTELSFAFVAMCRAGKIPARMVTAWSNRNGGEAAVDTVNHRWAEFWDDRRGWVPVDLARAVSHTNPFTYSADLYFGRAPASYLVIRDDGLARGRQKTWAGYSTLRTGGTIKTVRGSAWQTTDDAAAELRLFRDACGQLAGRAGGDEDRLGRWADEKMPLARFMMIPLLAGESAALRSQAAGRLADGDDPTMAGPLLVAAKGAADEPTRQMFLGHVARMLRREAPPFRVGVLQEIGRNRLVQARPMAEQAGKDDANLLVRLAAAAAVEKIDAAKGKDDGADEQ